MAVIQYNIPTTMTTKKIIKIKQLTASEIGSLGGKATAKKGVEYMQKIGKQGAKARWGKK